MVEKMTETAKLALALVGLGDVGRVLAADLLVQSVCLKVSSRHSARSLQVADDLGLPLILDPAELVRDVDLVLIAVPGEALADTCDRLYRHLQRHTLVVDLTSASPEMVAATGQLHPGGASMFVDGAIMGAVSIQRLATPLLLSGEKASAAADALNSIGFSARAMPNSRVGDASRVKLLRSIFAKGMDALMVESVLAAEVLGLGDELQRQLDNFDRSRMRDHKEMYLRTHPIHAERRLAEMKEAERHLLQTGIPSITTRATIQRYERTVELLARYPLARPEPTAAEAAQWLLQAELREACERVPPLGG